MLGPFARVLQEGAGDDPWALIGAASLCMQGIDAEAENLEFMTTEATMYAMAEMLDVTPTWGRGPHLAAQRLHFTRHEVPIFVFASPVFHGRYDSLTPLKVPSLWDARLRIDVDGGAVPVTPVEWELLLAVVLDVAARVETLRQRAREQGFDNRLLTRLMREGRVEATTEEAVWGALEQRAG